MELLIIVIAAFVLLMLLSYPINGHGGGWYTRGGPDGDRGPEPGTRPSHITRAGDDRHGAGSGSTAGR
jgi:hypothetical protein